MYSSENKTGLKSWEGIAGIILLIIGIIMIIISMIIYFSQSSPTSTWYFWTILLVGIALLIIGIVMLILAFSKKPNKELAPLKSSEPSEVMKSTTTTTTTVPATSISTPTPNSPSTSAKKPTTSSFFGSFDK